MQADRTKRQILQQLDAMHADRYEIGIGVPKGSAIESTVKHHMGIRIWDREAIETSIPFLMHQNAQGYDLYVRPNAAEGAQHHLSLVDDLSADALNTMMRTGYQPSVIVETSPRNFQAWLDHGQVLDHQRSTEAARELAQHFGGDKNASDYRHFGRMAGVTNRKEKHVDVVTGYHPFVKLHLATQRVYDRAPEVLRQVERTIAEREAREQRYAEYWKQHGPERSTRERKTIADFRKDPRYGGDHNREDFAFALYAAGVAGLSKDDVRQQIAARDGLTDKKHGVRGAERYVDATVEKAYARARGMGERGLGR